MMKFAAFGLLNSAIGLALFTFGSRMLLLAHTYRRWSGRACLLCPAISDIDLFGYRKCIIDFDAKVTDCALDLRVAQKQLDCT